MELWVFVLSFIGVYLIGGRKVAVPYGMVVSNNVMLTIAITFLFDFLQIPFYYFIFSIIAKKIKPIERFRKKQEEKAKKYKVWKFARRYGKIGILILASLPSFGGGIWTSVLLAFVLKLDKKISSILITLGSLVGIIILALATQGILAFIS